MMNLSQMLKMELEWIADQDVLLMGARNLCQQPAREALSHIAEKRFGRLLGMLQGKTWNNSIPRWQVGKSRLQRYGALGLGASSDELWSRTRSEALDLLWQAFEHTDSAERPLRYALADSISAVGGSSVPLPKLEFIGRETYDAECALRILGWLIDAYPQAEIDRVLKAQLENDLQHTPDVLNLLGFHVVGWNASHSRHHRFFRGATADRPALSLHPRWERLERLLLRYFRNAVVLETIAAGRALGRLYSACIEERESQMVEILSHPNPAVQEAIGQGVAEGPAYARRRVTELATRTHAS